ncbi:hypothetical protein LCGC14_0163910 [marine sediment metagenome]|uniref:Uncharacterized protein n=1 Tax=marine sediment metagenome TaxID=412755 RepID=A0A0F9VAE2_9ZZZZ
MAKPDSLWDWSWFCMVIVCAFVAFLIGIGVGYRVGVREGIKRFAEPHVRITDDDGARYYPLSMMRMDEKAREALLKRWRESQAEDEGEE